MDHLAPPGPSTAVPSTASPTSADPAGIDPRGPRVAAGLTAVLLAATVLAGATVVGTVLLSTAVALFAVGVVRGVQGTPQAAVFRRLVRPRLGPATELEDPRPPRFAQVVGLVVTGLGLVLSLVGIPAAGPVSAAVALVAALLNAVVGLCLGCELYLVGQRLRRRDT